MGGGGVGLVETPVCCKIYKTLKGDPLEILENVREKRKLRISNCATVSKSLKRGPLGFFNIHSVAKLQKKLKETLRCYPKIFVKSLIVPKKSKLKNPRESKRDP